MLLRALALAYEGALRRGALPAGQGAAARAAALALLTHAAPWAARGGGGGARAQLHAALSLLLEAPGGDTEAGPGGETEAGPSVLALSDRLAPAPGAPEGAAEGAGDVEALLELCGGAEAAAAGAEAAAAAAEVRAAAADLGYELLEDYAVPAPPRPPRAFALRVQGLVSVQ